MQLSGHNSARHDVSKATTANRERFGSYYEKPSWWFRFRYDTQVKRKTCLHLLRKAFNRHTPGTVLEIGFGSGAVLFSFPRRTRLYGIEMSPSAVEHAKRIADRSGYKHADFRLAEGTTIPYPSDSMEVVIASHVLEHVEDSGSLLREVRRVLKGEGIGIILVPINEKYVDPNHCRRYTLSSLTRELHENGFRVSETLENELLFHVVEGFYFEGYVERWGIAGRLVAAGFNIPAALLPFAVTRWIDRTMIHLGSLPRQVGVVVQKSSSTKSDAESSTETRA